MNYSDMRTASNTLKELQNKAAMNYCLNKLLSEYMPSEHFEDCYKCHHTKSERCNSYEDLGHIPVDVFVDIYRLCLEYKLQKWDANSGNRLKVSLSKLERDVM